MRKQLLFFLLSFNLFGDIIIPQESKQLLLVQANDFNTTQATLQAYSRDKQGWKKVFKPISVNLGRKGLAWGEGEVYFPHSKKEPLKIEGDGKAPAGLFSLDGFFGYDKQNFNFPYLQLHKDDICVDDSYSKDYNTLIRVKDKHAYKSYELMRRQDNLYELGILVGHNKKGLKNRGSCIFIHIQKAHNSPTAGCTSLPKTKLLELMHWLDVSQKPLLLQLPRQSKFY